MCKQFLTLEVDAGAEPLLGAKLKLIQPTKCDPGPGAST